MAELDRIPDTGEVKKIRDDQDAVFELHNRGEGRVQFLGGRYRSRR
jgi:hypothetical protein